MLTMIFSSLAGLVRGETVWLRSETVSHCPVSNGNNISTTFEQDENTLVGMESGE